MLIDIIISLLFSAFFSGLEIAFLSSNKMRLEMENGKSSLIGRTIDFLYRHKANFISTILVGNNIALVVYGILMAQALDANLFCYMPTLGDGVVLLLQTVISTAVVLITGEFLPKTLCKLNPNFMLRVFALPGWAFYVLLYPVSKFSSLLSWLFLRLSGVKTVQKDETKAFSRVDLDYLVQTSLEKNGTEQEAGEELKIFQNALDFSSVKVRDCIVPRTEIEAVSSETPLDALQEKFVESGHSKIIVYDGDIDNIVGFIHSSEMFMLRHGDKTGGWTDHIREVPIVPETMTAQRLLSIFTQQKKSLAVVVDEFGGTSGIVTLEDLVEEIFGDIQDEHDEEDYVARALGNNEYLISARMEIDQVAERLGVQLPESEEYITVGGLILNAYQGFPKTGETVKVGQFEFKIIKNTTTKIELVRLHVVE